MEGYTFNSLRKPSIPEHEDINVFEPHPPRHVRRESVTLEFPGDFKDLERKKGHSRTKSSCMVHDLLEVNKLQDSGFFSTHASVTDLKTHFDQKTTDYEPLSKAALSQLVVSVRDLSQSLSMFSTYKRSKLFIPNLLPLFVSEFLYETTNEKYYSYFKTTRC